MSRRRECLGCGSMSDAHSITCTQVLRSPGHRTTAAFPPDVSRQPFRPPLHTSKTVAEQLAKYGVSLSTRTKKRSKFNVDQSKDGIAVRTVGGITFASVAEARRWSELRLLERAGQIAGLVRQPEFVFHVKQQPIFKYVADFKYRGALISNSSEVIEDVKSKPTKTAVYRLKKKLIEAQFGIKITEVEMK